MSDECACPMHDHDHPPVSASLDDLLADLAARAVKVDIVVVQVDGADMDEYRFVIDPSDLTDPVEGVEPPVTRPGWMSDDPLQWMPDVEGVEPRFLRRLLERLFAWDRDRRLNKWHRRTRLK